MSTRSLIIRENNGKYEARWCHFDGYPSGVGQSLQGYSKEFLDYLFSFNQNFTALPPNEEIPNLKETLQYESQNPHARNYFSPHNTEHIIKTYEKLEDIKLFRADEDFTYLVDSKGQIFVKAWDDSKEFKPLKHYTNAVIILNSKETYGKYYVRVVHRNGSPDILGKFLTKLTLEETAALFEFRKDFRNINYNSFSEVIKAINNQKNDWDCCLHDTCSFEDSIKSQDIINEFNYFDYIYHVDPDNRIHVIQRTCTRLR